MQSNKHFPPISVHRLKYCVINKCYSLTPFDAPSVQARRLRKPGPSHTNTWCAAVEKPARAPSPCCVYTDRCSADLRRMLANTRLSQSNGNECSQHLTEYLIHCLLQIGCNFKSCGVFDIDQNKQGCYSCPRSSLFWILASLYYYALYSFACVKQLM